MDQAAYCETLVREADRDRFLSILFAPADRRPHLFALAAFAVEIARIRELVSQPTAGEIRLQWWREAIEGRRPEEVSAHPVAAALQLTIAENRLPFQAFDRLLEAHMLDLYADPIATIAELEGYAGDSQSALMRLAAIVLDPRGPMGADAAGHGGVAVCITGVLAGIGRDAARGQVFIPAEIMARHNVRREDVLAGTVTTELQAAISDMRTQALAHHEKSWSEVRRLPLSQRPAFLTLALVPLYLKALGRRGFDPFRQFPEVPQWRRQITLWRAARAS